MAQPSGQGGRAEGANVTPRELEVVRLIAEGLSGRETAHRLSRSPRTVENHLRSVYHKLGVRNRVEMVRRVRELGLLATDGERVRAPAELELKGRALEMLASLDRRLAAAPREQYFGELVVGLAETFGARWAGISLAAPDDESVEIVAFAADGAVSAAPPHPLHGSVCADAMGHGSVAAYSGARERYPRDTTLLEAGADAIVSVALEDPLRGRVGSLWIMNDAPIDEAMLPETVLLLLARRAAAELALARTVERLGPTQLWPSE